VLRGADGVVFVADSSPEAMHPNKVAWADMNNHLASHGISLERLPVVLQCNKQDLVCAVDPETMKNLLNLYNIPTVSAVALRGEGVLETLKLITRGVLASMQQQQVYA
jgi:signal recognition particle receptor subunit beta